MSPCLCPRRLRKTSPQIRLVLGFLLSRWVSEACHRRDAWTAVCVRLRNKCLVGIQVLTSPTNSAPGIIFLFKASSGLLWGPVCLADKGGEGGRQCH